MVLGLRSRKVRLIWTVPRETVVEMALSGGSQHRLSWLSTARAVFTSSGVVQNVDRCRSCKLTEIWDGKKISLVCVHVYVCLCMCVCTIVSGGLRIYLSGSVKTHTTVIKAMCVIVTIPW